MTYTLYPEIEPYRTDTLNVSDLHTMFYEEVGNPVGKPALFLHGGPGVGILPDYRRFFDPDFYRVILPDQRGAGRSTPLAELRENTTWEIVEDLEKLRHHLNIDQWLVMGGSWGSTLALCYAIKYPNSIKAIIIRGVFLARPFEIDWVHKERGAASIFPDEYDKFLEPLPLAVRSDPVKAYYRILTDKDENRKLQAAIAWSNWEGSIMNLLPDPEGVQDMTNSHSALSIGRIECQFTLNNFYMPTDNYILENIEKIKAIPCRIVQGRYDIICPVISAWDLHNAWPNSELRVVPDGSHTPLDAGMIHELVLAAEDFKRLNDRNKQEYVDG